MEKGGGGGGWLTRVKLPSKWAWNLYQEQIWDSLRTKIVQGSQDSIQQADCDTRILFCLRRFLLARQALRHETTPFALHSKGAAQGTSALHEIWFGRRRLPSWPRWRRPRGASALLPSLSRAWLEEPPGQEGCNRGGLMGAAGRRPKPWRKPDREERA